MTDALQVFLANVKRTLINFDHLPLFKDESATYHSLKALKAIFFFKTQPLKKQWWSMQTIHWKKLFITVVRIILKGLTSLNLSDNIGSYENPKITSLATLEHETISR